MEVEAKSAEKEEEQVVNPWEVSAANDGGKINLQCKVNLKTSPKATIEREANILIKKEKEANQDHQETIIITETTASSSPTMDSPESTPRNLEGVEDILGYKFRDKCLLEAAFTHPSYHYTRDNQNEPEIKCFSFERLEYLGDTVLDLLVTKEQFFLNPSLSSGQLTRLRAANVDTEKLARVAVKHELHCYLRHKKPLLEEKINEFKKEISEYPTHSNGLVDVPKVLADVVESVIGAVFIDSTSNVEIVWQVFKRLLVSTINAETLMKHPVTELHEICQKHTLEVKFVDKWKDSKAMEVLVDDQLVGIGFCASKKEIAKNRAALNALQNLPRSISCLITMC